MNTKKLLSVAAAVAVMSTGAMAFDTNHDGRLLSSEAGTAFGLYDTNSSFVVRAESNITVKGEGRVGDALIFPAFFAGDDKGNDWSSEFSIINTSDHAVIAKVVFYGKLDSIELSDFNVYLSAHDVFRAKLEKGRIISTDGSTVVPGSDKNNVQAEQDKNKAYVTKYKYTDNGRMVSNTEELNITLDPTGDHGLDKDGNVVAESSGYIAVFAMAEAESESYDKKHYELWKDYRHLLDTCRSKNELRDNNHTGPYKDIEWRRGITQGLYNIQQFNQKTTIYAPDVKVDANTTSKESFYVNNCQTVHSVLGRDINFTSPTATLTGSILVSHPGTDGKGRRDLLLKAYALDNVTDNNKSQLLLWSEGEFAHIGDRCIDEMNASGAKYAEYNLTCLENDAKQLEVEHSIFEYFTQDADKSTLVVTQPYKRILLQRKVPSNDQTGPWKNLGAYTKVDGEFDLAMELYDDDENHFTPVLGGFTVSPASTKTSAGVAHEVAIFSPFTNIELSDEQRKLYTKGYAILDFVNGRANDGLGLSAIITQMSATVHEDSTAETNWVYPYSWKND